MFILSIESSCDESSIAILKKNEIIDCLTISHAKIFEKIGGVVPIMATDLHLINIPILIQKIKKKYKKEFNKLKAIAYTNEPGLIGALHIGKICAKTISSFLNIPLIPVNHLHGHIYATEINNKKIIYPAIGLVISGGHTNTFYLKKEMNFKLIGQTLDDAAGEMIDKVARKLNLLYPGGPKIEKLAISGKHTFKIPIYNNLNNYNYSFSGIKTHCINLINNSNLDEKNKRNFAFSLQETVFNIIVKKLKIACKNFKAKTLIIGGGVISNSVLQNKIKKIHSNVLIPKKEYCTDNAAMIGLVAYKIIKNKINE